MNKVRREVLEISAPSPTYSTGEFSNQTLIFHRRVLSQSHPFVVTRCRRHAQGNAHPMMIELFMANGSRSSGVVLLGYRSSAGGAFTRSQGEGHGHRAGRKNETRMPSREPVS